MLGYESHAHFRLENKMAKDPKRVEEFLLDLRQKLLPLAKKELETLQTLKAKDLEAKGESEPSDIESWDFHVSPAPWETEKP